MKIKVDDLKGPEIRQLLQEHLQNMFLITPRESVHALDIDELRKPDITFWTVWENGELLGCGALKELDQQHGEIKSMRTSSRHRNRTSLRRSDIFIANQTELAPSSLREE